MFAAENTEDVLARLRAHGAELIGELEQYEDSDRRCQMRGPRTDSERHPEAAVREGDKGRFPASPSKFR